MLSDEEVICTWMEDRDALLFKIRKWVASGPCEERLSKDYPRSEWWKWTERPEPAVFPIPLTLVELHEVEARLGKEQRLDYFMRRSAGGPPESGYWRILHADAPTKIIALAAVLRPEVEGKRAE